MTAKKLTNDTTFIKVTNKDIWNMLQEIKDDIHDHKEESEKHYGELLTEAKLTNGKVKMNRRLIFGLGSATLVGFVFVINKIFGLFGG